MPEVSSKIKCAVERAIRRVEQKFRGYQDVFLTEEDIRCNLFSELLKEEVLSNLTRTQDNSSSIPIHSEVRWYGSDKSLRTRSDIVLFNVSQLITTYNNSIGLSSKGYAFGDPWIVIEIKLRRVNGPGNPKWKESLLKDIRRMKELQSLVDPQALYYFIIFDKKSDIGTDIPNDPTITINYIAIPRRDNQRLNPVEIE